MSETLSRPFYTEYAWAFDLLIDRPVEKECGVIAAWLVSRQILPGAAVLDAGCGTGRYSRELARGGYIVHGVDLSPELIEVAKGTVGLTTGGPIGRRLGAVAAITAAVERARELVRSAVLEQNLPETRSRWRSEWGTRSRNRRDEGGRVLTEQTCPVARTLGPLATSARWWG